MGSASLQFIGYGIAVAILINLNASVIWRQLILLLASAGFLTFFSSTFFTFVPLLSFVAFGFLSVRTVQVYGARAFLPLLIIAIIAFVWLKKYAFIPATLLLTFPYVTLGLSYIFFRVLHLIIDAHGKDLPSRISVLEYLNYTLNFTTLVSGPIQTYQEFAQTQLAETPLPLNTVVIGHSLTRIIAGFFKVNVLSLFLLMAQTSALTSLSSSSAGNGRIITVVIIVAIYPLYLYCNFSGYIDVVIGIARLMRIELPENFNRPFSSQSFLIFWSRWHITLSAWLKTYVYNPLLISCMQRWQSPAAEPFIAVFAFFFTFFLIGAWHGQTSEFLFYGVPLGLGVSVNKLYQILMAKWLGRPKYNALTRRWLYGTLARGITFTWFAFSLLWFWSNWAQLGTIAASLRGAEMAAVWLVIWVASSLTLAGWELARRWLLSYQFENRPLILSRYFRTVACTVYIVVAVVTIFVLNSPAPDIVYKAF